MEWDVFLCARLFCFLSLHLILRPSTHSCKSIFSHFSRLKSIIYFTYGPLPSLSLLVQPVLRDQNHHLKTSIRPSPHSGGTWTLKSWDSSIWGRLLLQSEEKKQELTGHHWSIWDTHLFQIFFFFSELHLFRSALFPGFFPPIFILLACSA